MRISDWSSDVCSSDFIEIGKLADAEAGERRVGDGRAAIHAQGALRTKIDEFIINDEVPDVRGPLDTGMILEIIDVRGNAVLLQIIRRSEEHTSELQSLMRISYAVFCLIKKNTLLI